MATKKKPGFLTSEFWMSTAVVLGGLLLASGAITDDSMAAKIVGGVLSVLATLGYTNARAKVKAGP